MASQAKKASSAMDSSSAAALVPLPLPPPLPRLREFSFEELAGACLNFAAEFYVRNGGSGPVYRATIRHSSSEEPKQKQQKQQQQQQEEEEEDQREGSMEVSITVLSNSHSLLQSSCKRRWRTELESVGRLSHPNVCRLVGFTDDGAGRRRLLVFEAPALGSLDTLLYGRSGRRAPLDWASRLKIALGAAQGLAFLHDRMPRQIVYKRFKTSNIQVDHDFNAKLSDYYDYNNAGVVSSSSSWGSSCASSLTDVDGGGGGGGDGDVAPELRGTTATATATAASNVWSFGVVLLELLTGRQNMDAMFPEEERELAAWCRPHVLDARRRLYLVVDPELKGRYATSSAKKLADLALLCLARDPDARPSMRNVAAALISSSSSSSSPQHHLHHHHQHHHHHKLLLPSSTAIICRSPSYGGPRSKAKLSKSHSLASVLTSPRRIFPDAKALDFIHQHRQLQPHAAPPPQLYPHFGKPRFFSGEMLVRRRPLRPPSFGSVSGEILVNP